jgi:hypothetical protein
MIMSLDVKMWKTKACHNQMWICILVCKKYAGLLSHINSHQRAFALKDTPNTQVDKKLDKLPLSSFSPKLLQ